MSDSSKNTIEYDFGFKLDDFQEEALNYINQDKSVIVCAPTGAGKTVIAEFAIQKALREGKRLFYTTPLKALSNQKFHDFQEKYGKDKAGLLTGDTSNNRDAQIVVMTTEVFRNMLYGTNLGKIEENLKNVGYVVLDEVHYMNDEQRGTVWEESIIYSPNNIQIVALSATVANAEELTNWINTVHNDTKLVDSNFRPVPLRHFYYSEQQGQVIPLLTPEGKMNNKISPDKRDKKSRDSFTKSSVSNLILQLSEKEMLPAIHFTFSRKKCDKQVKECSKLKLLTDIEKAKLHKIINDYLVENPYLARHRQLDYLYAGVASHHAGLLPAWKNLVEYLFQQGLIKAVFATETLAAGINMPARTTIISSITKRTDDGHRVLTGSEFLQMSGRAGRRGMDKVGYVVTVGSPYRHPDEVVNLVLAKAEPLQSKFAPSYSMVLNLLQRFNIDEAKELILKSFGYFSSNIRLKPLYIELEQTQNVIDEITNFKCPHNLETEDVLEYNKIKNMYISTRKIRNTLKKQAKLANIKDSPEVTEYFAKTRELKELMEKSPCNKCRSYVNHIKGLDVITRFEKKLIRTKEIIEYEKDIYWRQFINIREVLKEKKHLTDNYPTTKGLTTSAIRSDNELLFAEIIFEGHLDGLKCADLAGVLCAIASEEPRKDFYCKFYPSSDSKRALSKIRDLARHISKIQKRNEVDFRTDINSHYSGIVEKWVNGEDWEQLVKDASIEEGDFVRILRRTVDLLRQLSVIPNVKPETVQSAYDAIECINRDPISEMT